MSRYRGAVLRIVRRLGELPGLTRKTTRRTSRAYLKIQGRECGFCH